MSEYFEFAHVLADLSAPLIAEHFRDLRGSKSKADRSLVTEADTAAEALMRAEILARYPTHGILGEEGGAERSDAEFVWVLDPIDGTLSYVAGIPTFATLIGLLHHGVPILGIVNQPVTGQRFAALKNHQATMNGTGIETRPCSSLSNALLATTSPTLFDPGGRQRFESLRDACGHTVYGTDCFGYAMLAAGRIDLVVESGLKAHDILPLVPIVEAAGGVVTDWRGEPLGMRESYDVIACGDPALLAATVDRLA